MWQCRYLPKEPDRIHLVSWIRIRKADPDPVMVPVQSPGVRHLIRIHLVSWIRIRKADPDPVMVPVQSPN